MKLSRILKSLWPWRWWNCLQALAGGARLHPSACLLGSTARIRLGRGTSIGSRSRLDAGSAGQIVLDERVWASSDVEIETNSEVHIGEGTTIQRRCTINGSTRIGANCIFAPNVFVSSGTHPFRVKPHIPIREQERTLAASNKGTSALDRPVWIQDDCWLGANVVVCPGVTIGKGSVVGANAVVTRDVAPYSVVAGSPAKSIGRRLEWLPRSSICAEREEDFPYILSGHLRPSNESLPARFEVTHDIPFLAVLSAKQNFNSVLYNLIAPESVEAEIDGHIFEIQAGINSFEVTRTALRSDANPLYCTIKLREKSKSSVLWIVGVETLGVLSGEID